MANTTITPGVGATTLTGYSPGITYTVGSGAVSLRSLTGSGLFVSSLVLIGAPSIQVITATGQFSFPVSWAGAPALPQVGGVGYLPFTGTPSLKAITATGRIAYPFYGAAILEPLQAGGLSGFAALERLVASGVFTEAQAETYMTIVMNTRNLAVTEYQNFNFTSYALVNGRYCAAGPAGLMALDGTDDNGTNINWSLKTGQMDDKAGTLKRLPEVVIGLRSSGPVRVRIWKDDGVYFDHMLPATKTDTIHQQRVTPGKGMRSRYFAVELQGVSNAASEIDSMQVNMAKLKRRVG